LLLETVRRKSKIPKLDEEAKRKLKEEIKIKLYVENFFNKWSLLTGSKAMKKFFSIMKFKNNNKHFFQGAKDALSKQKVMNENYLMNERDFWNYCLKEMERMLGNNNFGEKELNEFLGLTIVFLSDIRLLLDIYHEDLNLPFFKKTALLFESYKDKLGRVYKLLNNLQSNLLDERKLQFEDV